MGINIQKKENIVSLVILVVIVLIKIWSLVALCSLMNHHSHAKTYAYRDGPSNLNLV